MQAVHKTGVYEEDQVDDDLQTVSYGSSPPPFLYAPSSIDYSAIDRHMPSRSSASDGKQPPRRPLPELSKPGMMN